MKQQLSIPRGEIGMYSLTKRNHYGRYQNMDADKRKRYEKIAADIVRLVGGRDNIIGVAHCATRLRLVQISKDQVSRI